MYMVQNTVLPVILALAVVIQFLGLLYRIGIDHNQEDALILKISTKVKPVMTCWLDSYDSISLFVLVL